MSTNSTTTQDEVAQRNKINSDYRESLAGDSLTHVGTQGRGSPNGNARRLVDEKKDKIKLASILNDDYYYCSDIH